MTGKFLGLTVELNGGDAANYTWAQIAEKVPYSY